MYGLLCIAVFGAGFLLPPDTIDDGMAALLVTFFGLLAAGIIPAMSLLVGNVLSPSKSVARIITLKGDLDHLLARLGWMLATIIVAALIAMLLAAGVPDISLPSALMAWLSALPADLLSTAPTRVLQALALVGLFVSIDRLRIVYRAFNTVLNARFELALEEAKRTLEERAPKRSDVARGFPTPPGFGARVPFGNGNGNGNET